MTAKANTPTVVAKTCPFLKWAGGKLKLVPMLKQHFPVGRRFIEPFLGAGSVSLNVDYPQYVVNDSNADLMSVWRQLQENGDVFIAACKKLFTPRNNTLPRFTQLKQEFNTTTDKFRKATLFVYLNRHCFNGLCRYNSSGAFNVPFGKYDSPKFPEAALVACCAKSQKFEIHNEDFRDIFELVRAGDVVYCDPPYLPLSASASFSSYVAGGFSLQDQIDLAACAAKAADAGATVVISNHHNWYARQLYTVMFESKIHTMEVPRTISGTVDKREPVTELIAVFRREKNAKSGKKQSGRIRTASTPGTADTDAPTQ